MHHSRPLKVSSPTRVSASPSGGRPRIFFTDGVHQTPFDDLREGQAVSFDSAGPEGSAW